MLHVHISKRDYDVTYLVAPYISLILQSYFL
jgi:hypothetical protein